MQEDAEQLVGLVQGDPALERPPHIINAETQSERAKIYVGGGVVFVSARILVVDLLRAIIPYHLITGVLVSGAHSIEEHGALAFALRLVRFHCPASTFIKGLR
jgi:DNA excision repair protein ERCC-4